MILQQIFIANLKKFRKKRGMSQMTLADRCGTSGNYIGEIEMGRRIPSFEKIEKIAAALRINSYQLFVQDTEGEAVEKEKQGPREFLEELPFTVRQEIASRLLNAIHQDINESLDPKYYEDYT